MISEIDLSDGLDDEWVPDQRGPFPDPNAGDFIEEPPPPEANEYIDDEFDDAATNITSISGLTVSHSCFLLSSSVF